MTDPRRAAELAVIEAARLVVRHPLNLGKQLHGVGRLQTEVHALDSLPPAPTPPAGPTERVRAKVVQFQDSDDGTVFLLDNGQVWSRSDVSGQWYAYELPPPCRSIPEIAATVEPGE